MPEPSSASGNGPTPPGQIGAIAVAAKPAGSGALRQAVERVFSFPVMLAFLLVVLAVFTVRQRFDDPDMWWHMKMGQIVWTTHTIPTRDIFSYTTNHYASVPQEWLGEVTIYLAYKLGGYGGLMFWLCVFTSALFIAAYGLCTAYGGNVKVAFVGAVIVWLFSTIGLSIRPQMIGYLLLIVELFLIHLGRTRNPRWFLSLPVLFALWINCHGSFFLGIVVAGIFLFSSFFQFQAGSLVAPRWDPAQRRMLLIALLISAGALFLNPDGIHQIAYPLDAMLHQKIQLANVQEWQPIPMTDPRGLALLLVLLSSFLTVVLRRSELFFDELLMLAAATWLGVGHRRTLFAFGILAAPILCRHLSGLWEGYEPEKDPHWLNAVFMAGSLLLAFFAFPNAENLRSQVEADSPVKAVVYIQSHHLAGPMLNDYGFGGYLIWAAPEYPVFIDGRGDIFEWSGVLGEYGAWSTLQEDPRVLLRKYEINFCLLAADSTQVKFLKMLADWRQVYADGNAVIFVRR
ncbi:MAG TPA: hypothetical protein VF730_18435 [Terracidiphilus sp.]